MNYDVIIKISDEELLILACKFKLLSELSRLKILKAIADGEKSVAEIINITGLLQANVSKQLKILFSNNIIACKPIGQQRFYSISDDTVIKICNLLCNSYK